MTNSSLTRRIFVGAAAASTTVLRSLGANNKINIGMVGVGTRGSAHVKDLIALKDLNITIAGICDVWRVNREKAAAAVEAGFGAKPKTTTDYRELLSWKDIDAIVIATPDFTHPIILKAAVEAGKDAYVEKPFAVNLADAKTAYFAVKKSRQVVQCGTQKRSDPYLMTASKQVRAGKLGQVSRIEFAVSFQEPRWRRPSPTVNPADVDWKMFQMGRIDRAFDQRLFREWQLFSGVTTNGIPGLWMSHFIDLVPWFMEDPYPAGAVSNGGVYLWKDGRKTSDTFYTLLDYPKGFMVAFAMNLTNGAGNRNQWFGTLGTLDCDKHVMSGEGSKMKDKIKGEIEITPETTDSHMQNFLECIRSRQTPRADVQAGFSHAVADIMSAEALARGRRMRFDPAKLEIL
jgi:predicted dehydrogenase